MPTNLASVEKQAISSALSGQWEDAVNFNLQILDKKPNNLDALIRLGKAYIQTKNFKGAVKVFTKVLEFDPINPIALKNIVVAKEGKVERGKAKLHPKALIKEPGTTAEGWADIVNKKYIGKFSSGEDLTLKIKKTEVEVYYGEELIAYITNKDLIKDLNRAKADKVELTTNYIKEKANKMIVLIKSPTSIFKAERQDIKPYFKKGTLDLDEPELELGEEEEEVIEEVEEEE